MAGIIKRNNKWVAVLRTLDGREVRKTTGIEILPKVLLPGTNKRSIMIQNEARARLVAEEMEQGIRNGVVDNNRIKAIAGGDIAALSKGRGSLGVDTYLHDWLQSREGKRGAHDRDKKAVEQFLEYLGERKSMALSAVNRDTAKSFAERELERVSSGTVSRYVETLSCAFNRAIEKELIDRNPFKGARLDKRNQPDKQERGAFSAEEVKMMVETFPDEWPDMILVCLYTGGQRLGDVATLKWEQINLDGGLIAMTTEKTKRRMNKPMISPLKDILTRRLEWQVNEFVFPLAAMKHAQAGGKSSKLSLEFTGLLRSHGLIAPKSKEKEGSRRQLSEKSFHSLRATAVTMLRLAGVPADLCRFIVGHDSEEIERVYIRPQIADITGAMEKISKNLTP